MTYSLAVSGYGLPEAAQRAAEEMAMGCRHGVEDKGAMGADG
eukprot:CAMPEP_0174385378 /NCGR_PEP_ID=MMETSP0811_2-20130205/126564_1 /TAXON_ID=73025 ORGANISM="Eutreptiella gymnastica-like, Strain CCMP1594" /NCGR_SAMPLE_ID=MMETSP0811_2 /ASSEMBLY_ACC=CAM_ASM_000667 /LENGTH=41 /DNA_ID= /DNA_START= /DNA_END= /DNA_ORIENTATION=